MGILKWTQGQLDSLVTVLNSKAKQADLVSGLSSKASAIHNHDTLYAPSVHSHSEYVPVSTKGVANGVASLDSTGKVPSSQLPAATASVYGGIKVSLSGTTLTITA